MRAPAILSLLALVLLAGCAYPERNVPAAKISDRQGYQYHLLDPAGPEDTLIIVTASGGGTRATALALAVLEGMDAVKLADGETLAQQVDVISSVSGGSVAAGYFALAGREGFKTLEDDFVRQDGMTPLLWGVLNPVGAVRYFAVPGQERIDLLIDYLDQQLFKGATFQTLIEHKRRPYLLLNASDMVEGVPFPFTQRKLDLLCSDLGKIPLAEAVAASAAFPVALSPVTLKNYSPCAAQPETWPPSWVTVNLDPPGTPPEQSIWYQNPARATLGRVENAYALGDVKGRKDSKLYIHLLDGGIADNLGIFEPYRMLTTQDALPSFLTRINRGDIKKLVFIAINARSFAPSDLDQQQATPGMVDMLLASINAPIDRATAGTAAQLRELLDNAYRQVVLADPSKEQLFRDLAANTALISIDFDAIVDADCRRKFHSIPTSWSLTKAQIDAVMKIGPALLAHDPAFEKLKTIVGGHLDQPLPTVPEACAAVDLAQQ